MDKDTKEEEVVVCEYNLCNGDGIWYTEELTYPGEPHSANIGVRACPCKIQEQEYNNDDEE